MPEPHLAVNGYFLDDPASGSGQYVIHLLRELEHAWTGRISVLVPESKWEASRGAVGRAAVVPVGLAPPGALGKAWFEHVGVPRAAGRVGAALLHVPYFGAPASSRVPVVVTVHDLIQLTVPRLRGGPLNRMYNVSAAVGARRAAALITDSDYARGSVIKRLHARPENVRTVRLAADSRFTPEPDPAAEALVRSHYRLDGPFLLYMGGLDWRKNVPFLVRAYARSGVRAPLAIAGAPRSRLSTSFPDLQGEVRGEGVEDRVRFLGWVDEAMKPALYRSASLFVYPSLYEGFGLNPLEALASGTPTLCSNATSLPEVVGDAALLFDPRDEARLAGLIQQAMSDESLRGRLKRAGPERSKHFDWRDTARLTIAIYAEVANTGTDIGRP